MAAYDRFYCNADTQPCQCLCCWHTRQQTTGSYFHREFEKIFHTIEALPGFGEWGKMTFISGEQRPNFEGNKFKDNIGELHRERTNSLFRGGMGEHAKIFQGTGKPVPRLGGPPYLLILIDDSL